VVLLKETEKLTSAAEAAHFFFIFGSTEVVPFPKILWTLESWNPTLRLHSGRAVSKIAKREAPGFRRNRKTGL
jgi:hypothetical protein